MGPAATSVARRLVLASTTLLLLLSCLPSQAADRLAAAKARGDLQVAMMGNYPPFSFVEPDTGKVAGYDADVAQLLAAHLGLKVVVVPTVWSDIIPGLVAGKYDLAVSQVSITARREAAIDFSEPYTYSSTQLILRNNDDATYSSLTDLKGKIVGVAKNTIFETQVRAVPGVQVRSYPGSAENLQDLVFGRIDASLNDSLMVAYLLSQSRLPVKAGPLVGIGERIGVAIQKGNPALKAAVNLALRQAQADGSLARLSRKWFKVDASRPYP
jgi:cystine transport system substrate-binding protein